MAAKLSVETQFDDLLKGLEQINKKAQEIQQSFDKSGQAAGDAVTEQSQKTEKFLTKLGQQGKRVAQSMKDDFKALLGLNAIAESLKISNQFKGALEQVVDLQESILKFGSALGLADSQFGTFQANITRSLGRIGLGADSASRSLKGLMGTGVKGENQLIEYSSAAGQLASVSKTQGSEDQITRLMASVLRAQGKDVNDVTALKDLSTQVNRGYQATGKSPEELLRSMESMFSGMSQDFRKRFSLQSMTQLAAASQVAGPEATTFLEQYMKMSPIRRRALDAQGMAGVIRQDGTLDTAKFGAFSKNIRSRVGGDPQLAAETMGISEDAAKGFLRLGDNLDRVREAQDAVSRSTRKLGDDYRNSMSLGESFRANLNNVKSIFARPLAALTGGLNDALNYTSQSKLGSGLVTGGAAVGAAALAGFGLRSVGKGTLGGLAKGGAIEAATGREVQPVYVVNAQEIGSASMGGLSGGPAGGRNMAAQIAMGVAGVATVAPLAMRAAEGSLVAPDAGSKEYRAVRETFGDTAGEGYRDLMNSFAQFMNLFGTTFQMIPRVQVEVTSRDPAIKATTKQSRGEAQ